MNKQQLNLASLENTLALLQEALAVVTNENWFSTQKPAVQKTLLAGMLHNFKLVYEISTKMLKRQLAIDAASPEEISHSSFDKIFCIAAKKGLINQVEPWLKYRLMCTFTSQAYTQKKSQLVYKITPQFIVDTEELLQNLKLRNTY